MSIHLQTVPVIVLKTLAIHNQSTARKVSKLFHNERDAKSQDFISIYRQLVAMLFICFNEIWTTACNFELRSDNL